MKKKINITFVLLILLTLLLTGSVFADENDYIITKEYVYQNNKKYDLTDAFVEILIGSGDFVQYQDDEYIRVSPNPDEIKEDEFGNVYAYYDLSGLKPGEKFSVSVKRKFTTGIYSKLIPARTNTEYVEDYEKYLSEQERIDSDNGKIMAKAKELTEDIASDYKKAQAIFEFVNVNMVYTDDATYANKGSVSALDNMKGVCEEFTTLFVALCRVANIPSRAVEGYKIETVEMGLGEEIYEEKSLTNHVWAEIYLQDYGWVPVDPTTMYDGEATKRPPYLKAFCQIEEPEYIANGIYNYEFANRTIKGVEEIVFEEELEDLSLGDNYYYDDISEVFEDIGNNYDWAKKAIGFLYDIDVIKGYLDLDDEYIGFTYKPEKNTSRIEFITMLARVLEYKETSYDSKGLVYYYMDYNKEHWASSEYEYLLRCYQAINPSDIVSAGFYTIASVFDEGSLDPDKPITRGEVVALLDAFLPENNTETKLTDIKGSKFEKSIRKAYNYGLIVGYPDMTFRPNDNITRAEIAVILERYIGNEVYNII